MANQNELTTKQLATLKEKLVEDLKKVEEVENEVIFSEGNDSSDEADVAAADYSQAQLLRMRNRGIFYAKKLTRALKKVEDGEYGLCEDCGSAIKYQRLFARPTAELCIDCKEEAERDEQASIFSRQSKSMGDQLKVLNPNI